MKVLILDSGAVTSLAHRYRGSAATTDKAQEGEPLASIVPSVVLVECLSGRQRTDAMVNRFLKKCVVIDAPDEKLARRAGSLRARAGRGSAADAVVVAPGRAGRSSSNPRHRGPPSFGCPRPRRERLRGVAEIVALRVLHLDATGRTFRGHRGRRRLTATAAREVVGRYKRLCWAGPAAAVAMVAAPVRRLGQAVMRPL